jgi:site-specific recombinase XerD
VVFYGNHLRDTLNKYCKVRGGVPKNTLIESYKEKEKPLTLRGVQHIVRQIVQRSRIKKRISPHTFRHTFAVHYLNAGGSIFHLQKLLGHEFITTTLNYLKPNMEDLFPRFFQLGENKYCCCCFNFLPLLFAFPLLNIEMTYS